MQRLQRAQRAAAQGRYRDALRDHAWFHAHALEHDPALSGVRLSFALRDWAQLAQAYAPAHDALGAIRDAAANTLLAGGGDAALFAELLAIDRYCDDVFLSYTLLLELERAAHPACATFARLALPVIVHVGDFARAMAIMPAPEIWIADASAGFAHTIDAAPAASPAAVAALHWAATSAYLDAIYVLLEPLKALHGDAAAHPVRTLAIDAIANPTARECVRAELQAPEPDDISSKTCRLAPPT